LHGLIFSHEANLTASLLHDIVKRKANNSERHCLSEHYYTKSLGQAINKSYLVKLSPHKIILMKNIPKNITKVSVLPGSDRGT
jgi:hypothetical protein